MKSLLRMSEEELAELEAGEGFRPGSALAVASLSGLLALAGMMLQYSEGDAVPIAGMDTFEGQRLIAAALGAGMLLVAFLVRSVIVRRLQWAVLFSLALHLFLCIAMQVVVVDVPTALTAEVGDNPLPPRDITLPDYGGAESQTTQEQQQWQQPADMVVPETQQQQLERQQAEMQLDAELDPVEVQRQVAEASTPERQQQEQQRLEREQQLEMQRSNIQAQADNSEQVAEPEIQTADVDQPTLEARQMERSLSEQLQAARQMEALESQNDPTVEASELAAKQNAVPENDLNPDFQPADKAAAAAMTDTTADSVEVASAAAAAQISPTERSLQAARQAAAEANVQNRTSPMELASSEPQVQSLSVARTDSTLSAAATPSSGGAAALQRSSAAGGQAAAVNAQAKDSVQVAAAGAVSAPALSAAQVASEVSRGQARVPTGGGSAVALPSSAMGSTAARSENIGRSQAAESGPAMGAAVAQGALSGTGNSRTAQPADMAAAAGSPQQVAIAGAASSTDAIGKRVAAGPAAAAAATARSRQSLPSSDSMNGAVRPPTTAGSGLTVAASPTARNGLSPGSTDSSARLGQVLGTASETPASGERGSRTGGMSGSGRQAVAAQLPDGLLQAERTGALVIAGPQAPASNSMAAAGSLRGPRDTSLPRQASGLPLRAPSETSLARSRPGLPSRIESARLPGRGNQPAARPSLATASEVAALIRRSVPGISGVPESRISAGFSLRTPAARKEAVEKLGGSDASEAAVDRGLEWLAAHQYAAGNWSIHAADCKDHECAGFGTYEADPAATGMALLAFLGAGHTHKTGLYQQEVKLGLEWLLQNQADDGDLFAAEAEFSRFYSHGIAAIALCEAYGMTKDPKLQQPAQQAINYIVASQHPEFGGWRYKPRFESDTSVSGWQLMALKSGEMAGLRIPRSAYAGVANWLDSVEEKSAPGRFRYHPTKEVTEPMTAEGLLMRQYLGADRQDQALLAGASYLKVRLPRAEARDVYYWYYATQVMFHMQGEHWEAWNAEMRDMLVATQEKGGPARGSWDATSPTKDTWGRSGGRHYVTCLNLLMLEVYYRHLPLYIELNNE